MIVAGGVLGAQAAFAYYFVPITRAQYLQLETYFPIAALVGAGRVDGARARADRATCGATSRRRAASTGRRRAARRDDLPARAGAAVPARAADDRRVDRRRVVGALVARLHLGFDLDDTIILSIATLVLAIAGAIYEQLWHREVLRPLLAHLTQRYRVPVRSIAPSLSMRSKLMLSFGGVVLLACGMALLWGFVQYKNLATDSALRQSDLGLAGAAHRGPDRASARRRPADPGGGARVAAPDRGARPTASAVVYYLDDERRAARGRRRADGRAEAAVVHCAR